MFVCFHAGFSHRWVLSNHTLFSCSFPDPQQQKVHDCMSRRRQNMSDDALKTRSLDVHVRCTQHSHWGGSRRGPESSVCPQLCVHVCMWGCVHVCGRPCVYIFVQHILLSSEHCGAERTSSPGLWSNCPRQSACWEPFWVRRISVCILNPHPWITMGVSNIWPARKNGTLGVLIWAVENQTSRSDRWLLSGVVPMLASRGWLRLSIKKKNFNCNVVPIVLWTRPPPPHRTKTFKRPF